MFITDQRPGWTAKDLAPNPPSISVLRSKFVSLGLGKGADFPCFLETIEVFWPGVKDSHQINRSMRIAIKVRKW